MQGPIDFSNKQSTGESVLGEAPGVAVNVIMDATGTVRRRPGIGMAPNVYSGIVNSLGIVGMYATVAGAVYALGNVPGSRPIYRITAAGALQCPDVLTGQLRPIFAETELLLAIAGGGALEKVVLATDVSSRVLDNPPFASHVAATSSRLTANIANIDYNTTFDKSVVRFSDIANGNSSYAGLESWTEGFGTAGHFSAEAVPDPVVALHQNTGELFCFGVASLQVFDPDPTAVFAPAVTRELGNSAPYSVIRLNQQFAWLDNLRRFVLSDARTDSVISDPIKQTLDSLTRVDDCFGYRVISGPLDALVWTFPTDGRTFAFQQGSAWSEWQGWDAEVNNWGPLNVLSHTLSPTTHDNLVGTRDGHVGRFSLDEATDLGQPINARVETGFLSRGTDARKKCNCVYLSLRRGSGTGQSAPLAYLSFRDEPGPYSSRLELDLGLTGDREIVLALRSLGVYRRRQWKFEFSGSEPLELVRVTEDYDVLGT